MDTQVSEPVAPTGVSEDMSMLDKIFDESRAKRAAVAAKLEKIVTDLEVDTKAARQTEVQMQVINAYLGVIAADESAISRRISAKLKHVETSNNSKHNVAVVELLSRITSGNLSVGNNTTGQSSAAVERRLEQAFSDSGLDPVTDTELRTDPSDT